MAIKRQLGGDRIGAGNKMKVDLHGYERSTHDLGYLWRSSMSAGTLVPFLCKVAQPGDTWDIRLACEVLTHPTVGPLFGSFKVQLDVFEAPMRLYVGQLHNNKLGIGLDMNKVKLPIMALQATPTDTNAVNVDADNWQVNPSSLLAYLGIRGIGSNGTATNKERIKQGLPLLSYWDIYKNYYANKQEAPPAEGAIGAMIFNPNTSFDDDSVSGININGAPPPSGIIAPGVDVVINWAPLSTHAPLWAIIFQTTAGDVSAESVLQDITQPTADQTKAVWRYSITGNTTVLGWRYIQPNELPQRNLNITTFQLSWLDDMRERILATSQSPAAFDILDNATVGDPYYNILSWTDNLSPYLGSQNGLGIKTYQSDLFNNWLNTETIDGNTGINAISSVTVTGGKFTIDELQFKKKVYEMLNRIAVSGGTYDDWIEVQYDHRPFAKAETPMYHGGLIKELVFQAVVSNAEAPLSNGTSQPLGTLAGRGTLSSKHKGGNVVIKTQEHSYIIGIVSLTPRIDYSQGNNWDTDILTMGEWHVPALDQIGFQELITEQMAWFETKWDNINNVWVQKSAGKQPAWLNYMTEINRTFGNFAIRDNEMFMTLNRRYDYNAAAIGDLTTYIDPVKYNQIFAYTALDAQNFWVQIAIDATVRRKMSAKLMPLA